MENHDYYISELNVIASHVERLRRGLEQDRDRQKGQQQPEYALEAPARVEYDRTQLDAPPRPVQPQGGTPQCKCGLPAVLKNGTAKSTGKPWSGYFCAHKPSDPRNCGFKQWAD